MKKVLVVSALAGFINTFLMNDIYLYQKSGCLVFAAANNHCLKNEDVKVFLTPIGVRFFDISFNSKKVICKENFAAWKELKKIIIKEKFDVVHVHTPIPAFYLRFFGGRLLKNKTVVYTTHGLTFNSYTPRLKAMKYKIIERFLAKKTDAIICINNEDFRFLQTTKCKRVYKIDGVGFDYDKYSITGVDVSEYKKALGVPENAYVILSIGELSSRKNHRIIVEALSGLGKNIYYLICGRSIGTGGTKQELEELAKDKNVNLILLGHRKDIPQIIQCSNLGAIPSLREGLGMAGVQSLAGGIPLVGSNVQGIKDYIVDGETGYKFNPYDFNDARQKIQQIMSEQQNKDFSANCKNMAKRFSNAISHQQMDTIIKEIIDL